MPRRLGRFAEPLQDEEEEEELELVTPGVIRYHFQKHQCFPLLFGAMDVMLMTGCGLLTAICYLTTPPPPVQPRRQTEFDEGMFIILG